MSEAIDIPALTQQLSPEQLKQLLSCLWDESQQKFLYGPDAAELRLKRLEHFKDVT